MAVELPRGAVHVIAVFLLNLDLHFSNYSLCYSTLIT